MVGQAPRVEVVEVEPVAEGEEGAAADAEAPTDGSAEASAATDGD